MSWPCIASHCTDWNKVGGVAKVVFSPILILGSGLPKEEMGKQEAIDTFSTDKRPKWLRKPTTNDVIGRSSCVKMNIKGLSRQEAELTIDVNLAGIALPEAQEDLISKKCGPNGNSRYFKDFSITRIYDPSVAHIEDCTENGEFGMRIYLRTNKYKVHCN